MDVNSHGFALVAINVTWVDQVKAHPYTCPSYLVS
jgi:hypothetical protein